MYLTVKQQVKHLSKEEYLALKELCRTAKNLTNQAVYEIRQHYFKEHKYLRYEECYKILKYSPNYRTLNSNMAQQILREVDGSFRSFFGLKKLADRGEYDCRKIRLPGYLPKDGYATLVIGMVRMDGNRLRIPYSNSFRKTHAPIEITVPPVLKDKEVKEIRIIPKADAGYFELQYTYRAEPVIHCLDSGKAMAVDLGVNNLVTAVTSEGKSLIIDGRRIKAVNQWYNKENSRLQGIRDRQRNKDKRADGNPGSSRNHGRKLTKRQHSLLRKRNNILQDYMSKTARILVDTCIRQGIGHLVVGCNEGFQQRSDMGRRSNQNFVQIPYGKLRSKLRYLCELNGIEYREQEESYTSKASFWDRDEIPVYKEKEQKTYPFSGRRIRRGVYETAEGKKLNADVNAALNILRKSKVVSLTGLYSRGDVDTPERIRIA